MELLPTPTPSTMDTHLHFNVTPKAGGGYTTRLVTQEDLLTPELVAAIKAGCTARGITLTDEQITVAGEESAKARIAALARGRVVRRAFGLFTQEPTCGGSHPDPDFTPTIENMNVAVRGRLAPAGQDLFESLITFHRDAVLGDKVPIVTRVYNGTTRATDTITLGGAFRLNGPEDFGPEPTTAETTLGVFLQRTGGSPVRITSISRWTESEIFGSWPTTVAGTGNATLSLIVKYSGNLEPRTFIYGTSLPIV